MSECWLKHPEDYCTSEKGSCLHQGEDMECLATKADFIEVCRYCEQPLIDYDLGECKCW